MLQVAPQDAKESHRDYITTLPKRSKTKCVLSVDSLSRVHDQHDQIFPMNSTSELPSVDDTHSNLEICTYIVVALPIVGRTGPEMPTCVGLRYRRFLPLPVQL